MIPFDGGVKTSLVSLTRGRGTDLEIKRNYAPAAEVEATVSNVLGLQDACAYGVSVPGIEGKAGMVAILDSDSTLNLKTLYQGVSSTCIRMYVHI